MPLRRSVTHRWTSARQPTGGRLAISRTFENDEYDNTLATLPPDIYGIRGAEQTQQLYYPEFLPDANRPD